MILNNVKVKWARVGDNPAQKYASEDTEWTVDCHVTPEQSKEWVAKGFAQKERFDPEDGTPFVKIKRNTHFNKKNPVTGIMEKMAISAPFVKDKYGDNLGDMAIGNGSLCNVQYMERPWEYAGKSGVTATLVGVQVMELVEYEGGAGGDEFTYLERPTAEITETDDDDENIPF
jgi:hypothetical protein